MWRAGIGFHASHSAGAMLFSLAYAYLALEPTQLLFKSPFLLTLGLAYSCLGRYPVQALLASRPVLGYGIGNIPLRRRSHCERGLTKRWQPTQNFVVTHSTMHSFTLKMLGG